MCMLANWQTGICSLAALSLLWMGSYRRLRAARRREFRDAMRPSQCLWPVYEYESLTQNGKLKHADRVPVFIQMPLCTRFGSCCTRRSFEYGTPYIDSAAVVR